MAGIIPAGIAPAISAQIGKLAGETPVNGSTMDTWQSGVAISGEAGGDLVSIGTAGEWRKIHSLLIDINGLAAGAAIDIKLFQDVNGVNRKVYEQTFNPGTDPDGVWVINGTLEIHDILRVEVESNNVADDGVAIGYTYATEDM